MKALTVLFLYLMMIVKRAISSFSTSHLQWRQKLMLLVLLQAVCPVAMGSETITFAGDTETKAVFFSANMVVDKAEDLLKIVDRAQASGANTVLFSDSKVNTWAIDDSTGNLWITEMRAFYDGVKARGMDFIFNTITLGFGNSFVASDVNLTTGYPIKKQPLQAVNGELVPVSTAGIANGGFENYSGDTPDNWGFQDEPGRNTFVDTTVKRSGQASFRADGIAGDSSRINTTFAVKPWHQYTLTLWVKTENLSADNLLVLIRDNDDKTSLTNQRLSVPKSNGGRSYFNRPDNLTLDWHKMKLAFNSQDTNTVQLYLSVYGGVQGSVWWDDVRISDTPTLNWINRDDLPVSAETDDGAKISIPGDIAQPVDAHLGQSGYSGAYDTYHTPPSIRINDTGMIEAGDIVLLSGWHAMVTMNGQISASWNHPDTFKRIRTVYQRLENEFNPDGYLLNISEVRTGGFEPLDTVFPTSGQALANTIERAYAEIEAVAPGKRYYFWSDMVDPYHNAKAGYYQTNNTLEGSWETLDPRIVSILPWWEGRKIVDYGADTLAFFADRGFGQVLGAYYDADVETNYAQWQDAAKGVEGIYGSLFATWKDDYSRLEAFADLWW